MTTCKIDNCDTRARGRGLCQKHYSRWRRLGDAEAPVRSQVRKASLEFDDNVEPQGDCIVWTGPRHPRGYGYLSVNGVTKVAHRYAYERLRGPIPDGMYVDHVCWNEPCVRPDHLRLATRSQNNSYRRGPQKNRKYDLPRGVTKQFDKYTARLNYNGKRHQLGVYATPEEAGAVVSAARERIMGAFAGNG